MAYANISNSRYDCMEVSAEVIEHSTSGSTRSVTLKLYIWRYDYSGGTDIQYTVSGGISASGNVASYGSPVQIASKQMTVSVDDNGYAPISTITVNGSFQRYFGQSGSETYSIKSTISSLQLTSDSSGSGSGSGSGSSSGSTEVALRLYVYVDDGIDSVKVIKSWDEAHGKHGQDMSNGGWIYSMKDCIQVSEINVKTGYELNTYTFNNTVDLNYNLFNLTNADAAYDTWKLASKNYASITFATTVKEYKLSATAGTGSYATINRISSKKSGAPLGVLANGAAIYYQDVLKITFGSEAGYDIVDNSISGCTENSDGTFTVVDDVNVLVTTELLGLIYIDNGTSFLPCLIYIDNGVGWDMCIPYLDNGTGWDICS